MSAIQSHAEAPEALAEELIRQNFVLRRIPSNQANNHALVVSRLTDLFNALNADPRLYNAIVRGGPVAAPMFFQLDGIITMEMFEDPHLVSEDIIDDALFHGSERTAEKLATCPGALNLALLNPEQQRRFFSHIFPILFEYQIPVADAIRASVRTRVEFKQACESMARAILKHAQYCVFDPSKRQKVTDFLNFTLTLGIETDTFRMFIAPSPAAVNAFNYYRLRGYPGLRNREAPRAESERHAATSSNHKRARFMPG